MPTSSSFDPPFLRNVEEQISTLLRQVRFQADFLKHQLAHLPLHTDLPALYVPLTEASAITRKGFAGSSAKWKPPPRWRNGQNSSIQPVLNQYLPLEHAMKNAEHDEPGFWDRWTENFWLPGMSRETRQLY